MEKLLQTVLKLLNCFIAKENLRLVSNYECDIVLLFKHSLSPAPTPQRQYSIDYGSSLPPQLMTSLAPTSRSPAPVQQSSLIGDASHMSDEEARFETSIFIYFLIFISFFFFDDHFSLSCLIPFYFI